MTQGMLIAGVVGCSDKRYGKGPSDDWHRLER